jgi:N-acetyl sugar amidotransferase
MKEDIDWSARDLELCDLLDRYRKNDGNPDVVVPASGGKDSRLVAHLLRHKYNMNPITVTWKPHLYTDVGWQNLISMIDNGFSNLLVSPNGDVQRRLCQLAFKNLGHPFQPFIAGQRTIGPKIALKYDINLVFYGENVAEYGNLLEDNFSPLMDTSLISCFDFTQIDALDKLKLSGYTLNELIHNHNFSLKDLNFYSAPSRSQLVESGMEIHYMSYYRKWVPQESYYYAVENTGFEPNPKRRDGTHCKYAGLDDVIEDLHFYMQYIKFGMGRCTWDSAQEIRNKMLERDEAISLVRRYDSEIPKEYISEILKYLDMDINTFTDIVDKFRPPHLWQYSRNEGFQLKYQLF